MFVNTCCFLIRILIWILINFFYQIIVSRCLDPHIIFNSPVDLILKYNLFNVLMQNIIYLMFYCILMY